MIAKWGALEEEETERQLHLEVQISQQIKGKQRLQRAGCVIGVETLLRKNQTVSKKKYKTTSRSRLSRRK
jgi:hypothetical protein